VGTALLVALLVCACASGVWSRGRGGDGQAPVDPTDGRWKTVTYYELLGLERDAKLTPSDVNKAYRATAQLHHPDKFADRSRYSAEVHREAEKRFSRLVDAMKTLRSRTTRDNYEELLKNGKVDYSDVDWEAWNYAKWKAYEEYVNNFDHAAADRYEADIQLWLGGTATIAGLGICVWWIYGDQIKRYMRERERKAKRREERAALAAAGAPAAVAAASPSSRRTHKSDKRRDGASPTNGSTNGSP